MKGLRLIATGGALPGRTVTNEELSRTVDTSDEWITTRTGIRTRHYCTEGENAATLAIAAAKQALQRSGLAPADIACCVCATLSAPDATPSVACQVQAALALPENRPALDVNAACSGFLYGTAVARGLLATLGGRYALVIGTEALSHLMDPADRSTCVLFGDGAGAALFELTDTSVPFAITLGARGDAAIHAGGPSRAGSAPISMDGRAVFRFAVDALPKCLHTVLDETGLTLDVLDWVVCHQANSRIIDHCVKALHADGAKFYKNMDRHGNTSAASIPVALNELAESGQLHPGQTLACIGFGGSGYLFRTATVQDFSAVTGACLLVKTSVWDEVKGLDEAFAVAFNDVDFCLRVRDAGYRIAWTPYAQLTHYESKSRGGDEKDPVKARRFAAEQQRLYEVHGKENILHDPYYNPNLTMDREDFSESDDLRGLKEGRITVQWRE